MVRIDWLDKVIDRALEEDLGSSSDLTTSAVVNYNNDLSSDNQGDHLNSSTFNQGEQGKQGTGMITAKEEGILAGSFVVTRVFQKLSDQINCQILIPDGQRVLSGQDIMQVTGPLAPILTAERLALNFYQRLSGIATETRKLVDLITPYSCELLDTRKTTPGLRPLEKYAVRMGGGTNHRMGLYDGVMIKDNHKKASGSITEAIRRVKNTVGPMVKISVEATNQKEAEEAYQHGADIILLDNMSTNQLVQITKKLSGKVLLEASGNISSDNISEIARTGVDYISSGSITHSAESLDLSFNLVEF